MSLVHRRTYYSAHKQTGIKLQTSPERAHDVLRSSIRTGRIRGDAPLIENRLITSLATSRNAVRQALQMLAQEGLVERRPRHGTSVVSTIMEVPIYHLLPSAPLDPARMTVRELDKRQVPAVDYVSERLGGTKGMLDVVEVLVLFDGEPMSRRVSYVRAGNEPVERVWDAVPLALAFEKVFGIEFGDAESSIEAVPASANASQLLGITPGAPLLVQELLLRDRLGVPRAFSYTHYRADRVSLTVRCAQTIAEGNVISRENRAGQPKPNPAS